MKTPISRSAVALIATSMLTGGILADTPVRQTSQHNERVEERTIFITGSLIPQRAKLRRIGTTTVSPVRIIDRREIDGPGRRTTPGAFINDPSLRIISY